MRTEALQYLGAGYVQSYMTYPTGLASTMLLLMLRQRALIQYGCMKNATARRQMMRRHVDSPILRLGVAWWWTERRKSSLKFDSKVPTYVGMVTPQTPTIV